MDGFVVAGGFCAAGGEEVEQVKFWRSAELRGVELRSVSSSTRQWRCFSAGFEFLSPRTWRGEIVSRRHRASVAPGALFCCHPEEVYCTGRVHEGGNFETLRIDADVFLSLVTALGYPRSAVQLRRVVTMSRGLATKLEEAVDALRSEVAPAQKKAAVAAFVAAVLGECLVRSTDRQRPLARSDETAAWVHRCLHADVSAPIDLQTLSSKTGLSRFQVLRAFRRSYGLPPHAYQLCVRIGLAQRALRQGAALAEVAVRFGFVDQSHFSRHFKRLVGVTPLEYASARPRRPRARVPSRARTGGRDGTSREPAVLGAGW